MTLTSEDDPRVRFDTVWAMRKPIRHRIELSRVVCVVYAPETMRATNRIVPSIAPRNQRADPNRDRAGYGPPLFHRRITKNQPYAFFASDGVAAALSPVEAMSSAAVVFNNSLARVTSAEVSQCTDNSVPPSFTRPFVAFSLVLRNAHSDQGANQPADHPTHTETR